ncbi:TPA: peptide-N-glycosidase [Candidatus Delongbacteria bacterium]|nr:peptide-N-glycosidase [Candidatus Delongbacteria bacterium]
MNFGKIHYFILASIILPVLFSLQAKTISVVYEKYDDGKVIENDSTVYVYYEGIASVIKTGDSKEQYFIDFNTKNTVEMLNAGTEKYKLLTPFEKLPVPVSFEKETEKILKYKCKKAVYSSFSNKIEVWFTEDTTAKGSPALSYFPENSLVLKLAVNGSVRFKAKSIKENKKAKMFDYPIDKAKEVTPAEYEEMTIKSRYTSVQVFDRQQINWQDSIVNPGDFAAEQVYRFSRGNVILKKVKLPKISIAGNVFIKVTAWSNGDAYDRTGTVFMLPKENEAVLLQALKNGAEGLPEYLCKSGEKIKGVVRTENYIPPVELMRFISSFGVGHFNDKVQINNYNWNDSVIYVQDVTSLIPADQEEIWIGMSIGNYDKGGHKASLELNYYPPEEFYEGDRWIYPLFNTANCIDGSGNHSKMFQQDSLTVEFDLPADIEKPYLLFTTTGHGGWGGGDEFNPKMNQVIIDGQTIFSHVPWRTDCSTYRMSNPASGNFSNGLSSSDLSRSNWCPGAVTPPFLIPLEKIKSGKHVMKIAIDIGKEDGNYWAVSGVIVGDYKVNDKK